MTPHSVVFLHSEPFTNVFVDLLSDASEHKECKKLKTVYNITKSRHYKVITKLENVT